MKAVIMLLTRPLAKPKGLLNSLAMNVATPITVEKKQ